jgi:hypothetical protein
MTTDSTPQEEPYSSMPQQDSATPGQNAGRPRQNFRRRRKRRGPGGNPGQNQQQPAGASQGFTPAAGQPPRNDGQPPRNDNPSRKQKKRFFKKNRGQGAGQFQNPGNAAARGPRGDSRGNTQQPPKRQGKQQRRPRVFVGPMDHSYRAANGNYADAPPSTIELHRGYGNGHGHFNGNGNVNGNINPEAILRPVARPGEENPEMSNSAEPTGTVRIYCFIDDLFFTAKIQENARKLGVRVAFVKNDKETVARLLDLPEEERPTLVVFDLNNANAKPLTLIPKLKAKFKRGTSIIGFLSHLQGELKVKALEAGCDTVMPRSAFSQNLPNLLRRYGIDSDTNGEDSQIHMLQA